MLRGCPTCSTPAREGGLCPRCGAAVPARAAVVLPMLLGLALAGCDGAKVDDSTMTMKALYGTTALPDEDEDGYTETAGDCDDTDAAIHPNAEETAGDGVDSNCDGADDT